jgi:hypothetical protein
MQSSPAQAVLGYGHNGGVPFFIYHSSVIRIASRSNNYSLLTIYTDQAEIDNTYIGRFFGAETSTLPQGLRFLLNTAASGYDAERRWALYEIT